MLSFIAGPHACIGKTMSIIEMKAVLAWVITFSRLILLLLQGSFTEPITRLRLLGVSLSILSLTQRMSDNKQNLLLRLRWVCLNIFLHSLDPGFEWPGCSQNRLMVCRCASDQFVTEHRFRHTTYLLPFPIIMCQFWILCFHICFVWSSPNLHLLGYSSTKRNLLIRIVWSGKVQNKGGRYFSRGSGVRELGLDHDASSHRSFALSEKWAQSRQVSIILQILQ